MPCRVLLQTAIWGLAFSPLWCSAAEADLGASISLEQDSRLTARVTVVNHGPDPAERISLTLLGAAVVNLSVFVEPKDWSCVVEKFPGTGDLVNCSRKLLAADETATLMFVFERNEEMLVDHSLAATVFAADSVEPAVGGAANHSQVRIAGD